MKEKIISLVGDKLQTLDLGIDDAFIEQEDGNTYLRIVLDAPRFITLNEVVMATRIINPLLDKSDIVDDTYILDVYAKEKGESEDER